MFKQMLKIGGAAIVAAATWTTAVYAAPVITTSATHYANGTETNTNSDNSLPSSFSSIYGTYSAGTAYSYVDGILNVSARNGGAAASMMAASTFAFPAPSGPESVLSVSTWEDTITNNTGSAIDYKFIFHVSNPRLQTSGADGDYAGLSLDILLNGTSVWSAFAEIDGSQLNASSNFSGGTPGMSGDFYANFASFDAAASLGTIAAGQTFTISYIMQAYINVSDPQNTTVVAAVGDPFFPTGEAYQIVTTDIPSTDVPAPAGLALLGLALTGLGLAQRRRVA